jgi:serine/threonine-protein kinase HipA
MKKLDVHLQFNENDSRLVGTLAEADRRLYFEYSAEFIAEPLWLSPFKLPPKPGLHEHRDLDFGPIFGVFDDSLPDGWGLLLMDRAYRKQGINPATVSVLDRLAYLGNRTMGAITYRPSTSPIEDQQDIVDLKLLANEAKSIWEGSVKDVLPQLLRHGGSPGGARPKILAGIKGNDIITSDILPKDFEHWIIKFLSPQEPTEAGKVEYVYSLMAKKAGIKMPPTRLFESSEGLSYFGIKRFDRHFGQRTHTHTFGNLIHSNYRIPNCDYLDLLKVGRLLTKNQQDVESLFRQAVFNVCSHNRDDHVKNFSFSYCHDSKWSLTPAYDLTFNEGPGGEHSMSICGEGQAPCRQDLINLASQSEISQKTATAILEEVIQAASQWSQLAAEYDIFSKYHQEINKMISTNIKRLSQKA